MKLGALPIANPIVVLREELDEWAVLFNPDTAAALGINPVGVLTWKLMDGSRDVAAITASVCDAFDETPETVCEEVAAFIKDLEERGFVGYELESG